MSYHGSCSAENRIAAASVVAANGSAQKCFSLLRLRRLAATIPTPLAEPRAAIPRRLRKACVPLAQVVDFLSCTLGVMSEDRAGDGIKARVASPSVAVAPAVRAVKAEMLDPVTPAPITKHPS